MVAPQQTRPNGMPYRRRAPLRVEEYVNGDGDTCLVVVGTHDLVEAAKLAGPLWDGDALPDGSRHWWRLVPWDTGHGQADQSWIVDDVRGRPVVAFEPTW